MPENVTPKRHFMLTLDDGEVVEVDAVDEDDAWDQTAVKYNFWRIVDLREDLSSGEAQLPEATE